jgi:ATP-dependent RNA helicase DeaD
MTTEFTSLNLRPELEQAILELGYATPTPIQAQLIPVMLTGVDVIGQAQTGTGKTAAFSLPILNNLKPNQTAPQALVLTPTRELALQVSKAIQEHGKHLGAWVLAVYGGASYTRQITQLKRGVDIVVGTPGRLIDLMNRGLLDISRVNTVVLDEADEMLSMGFVEDIEAILANTPAERQTALFSATMPTEIRRLAEKYMRQPQSIVIQREQVTVAAIEQRYYLVNDRDKTAALTRLFEVEDITSALIFVRTRAGTGDLANELSMRGFPAEALNGDLSQDARERTLNRFRENQIKVLVATDVAARGLDIDDISHVFNYDLPDDHEVYVHRIGRTGRAGKTGIAISLITPYEKRRLREVEHFTRQPLTRATLPTEADITAHREGELKRQMITWLNRARYKRERAMVEELVAEGFDPMEIASAALKIARADEKQRPIYPVAEVVEQKREYPRERSYRPDAGSRFERGPRPEKFSRPERSSRFGDSRPSERAPREMSGRSHEEGMVRLSLSIGKVHGIRPGDIVGTIAFHADIPGYTIGKISIQDKHTLVDVPEAAVGRVLAKNGGYAIRKQDFTVDVA